MKILQTRGGRWYLDKTEIISRTCSLKDIVFCHDKLEYSTMNQTHLVAENYKEAVDTFLNCFVAFVRFYEMFQQNPQYVWINKDADSPILNELFGKGCWYLGKPPDHQYKNVRKEMIDSFNARSVVIEQDWFYRFRDSLVLEKY